jgi:hypothetical protein
MRGMSSAFERLLEMLLALQELWGLRKYCHTSTKLLVVLISYDDHIDGVRPPDLTYTVSPWYLNYAVSVTRHYLNYVVSTSYCGQRVSKWRVCRKTQWEI